MPTHSQIQSDSVTLKLRNINHGLLYGLECYDKLETAFKIIEYKDSIIIRYKKGMADLLMDRDNWKFEAEKLKASDTHTLFDTVRDMGLGFAGGVIAVIIIILIQ